MRPPSTNWPMPGGIRVASARRRTLIQATIALAADSEARYRRLQDLAYGYIHGIPAQGWAGLLAERNDWEMYAGLASGMMADIRLVPPYIRRFYLSLFTLLPDDAPSPAASAPHG
ncbi:MAG: hypothetical protein ACRDID_04010, partial [Ktedonobacterales bacterium]